MALPGEEETINETEVNDGESSNATEVINSITPKQGNNQLTVEDIYSYEGSMSPEEAESMNVAGAPDLKPQDYFPDLNAPILQGTYSGPTIGSVSLFAPGGGLTPYTVIDAREKALEAASLKKAKAIDDFNKIYGKPPVTKHSSVQEQLNKVYFDGLKQWVGNAQKKYGDNWAGALKGDLNFQSWVRDANTLKEQEDYLVNEKATILKDIEGGKFVATPELVKSLNDFDAGVNGLAQGKLNRSGYSLNNSIATMRAEYDLSKSINESIEPVKYGVVEKFGINKSDPNYDQIVSTKMSEVPDETLKNLATQLKREKYFDNNNITEDLIFKRMRSMFPSKEEKTIQTAGKKQPESGSQYSYNQNDREDEIETNVYVSKGKNFEPRTGSVKTEYYYSHKKGIPAFLPQGRSVYLNDKKNGLVPTQDVDPNQEVVLGRTGLVKVLNQPGNPLNGQPVDETQAKNLPWKWQVMTEGKISKGRMTSKVVGPDGEEQTITSDEQTTFYVPAKSVENYLIQQKDSRGNVIKGIPVDEQYREAERRNAERGGGKVQQPNKTKSQTKSSSPKEGDTKTLSSGKIAIFRNGKWQLQ